MSTDTATVTYDKSAITRARRLGAWGPGLLVKHEGLWQTEVGTFIVGDHADGATELTYRLVSTEEAATLLREHGHRWRAEQILRPTADDNAAREAGEEPDATA